MAAAAVHPANQYMNVPLAVRVADEGSQPILPPRQTGRMPASASTHAAWKSWPVVVIAIAVLAIITAVILMVWPPGGAPATDAKTLAPPPAPERMDTNPLPSTGNGPSGSIDPWKAPGDPDVTPPPPPATTPDIDDIDPDDPGSLRDPFAGRGGNPLGRNPFGGNSQAMLGLFTAAAKHACDRLASCPSAGDPMVKSMCDISRLALPSAPVPTCAAAQRCLSTIDKMPCDDFDSTSLGMGMVTGIQDCLEAMRC